MVTDHTGTSKELTALAKGSTVPVPTALDAAHQKMLDTLKSASGADFDSTYKSQQVKAHKDAVSLFERYAKHGDNGDVKNWAGKTLPTLQNHLKMAEGLSA
jgi:putative membrane protein